MKKLSLALSVLGLSAALLACSDDGKKYCDAGYVAGCDNGEYVYCYFENANSDQGVVKSEEIHIVGGISFVCDKNGRLAPKGYTCKGGILNNENVPVRNNVIATANDQVVSCDGDDIIIGYDICYNDVIYSNRGNVFEESRCKDGLKCENYERDGLIYSGCFEAGEVTAGCDKNTSVFGFCNNADSSLTFCTSPNPEKGKTIRLDCAAQGKVCMKINDAFGFDCSVTCDGPDGKKYDDHGTCVGNVLNYCTDKGVFETTNCSDGGKTCEFASYQYDCI